MTPEGRPESYEDIENFILKHHSDPVYRDESGRFAFCLRDVFDLLSLINITMAVRCLGAFGKLKLEFVHDKPYPSDHFLYVSVETPTESGK